MVYFIELWNAKPEWLALSTEDRAEYMQNVGKAIQGLTEKGTRVLTWSENDQNTDRRCSYDFFAIWTFQSQDLANEFQQLVEGAGWYNYFEQVNAKGKENTVQDVIQKLVQL